VSQLINLFGYCDSNSDSSFNQLCQVLLLLEPVIFDAEIAQFIEEVEKKDQE
jgi:hypothetical protein